MFAFIWRAMFGLYRQKIKTKFGKREWETLKILRVDVWTLFILILGRSMCN